MKKEKDAYGQQILAYYKKEESYELIERDDGYIAFSTGSPAYFAEYKDWPKIQKQGIKFVKGKALDIGCGAGRIGLYLQKRGIDILGIDNSPLAIEVCKKRGVKKAKLLPIEKINTFKPNAFDTIIMMGNNFGLFANPKKAKRLLKQMHKITTEDALIIAESLDPYKTKDPNHLAYHKFNQKRGKLAGQTKLRLRFKRTIGDWFEYLFVSQKEMKEILKDTGWKIKKFITEPKKPMYVAIIEKV